MLKVQLFYHIILAKHHPYLLANLLLQHGGIQWVGDRVGQDLQVETVHV